MYSGDGDSYYALMLVFIVGHWDRDQLPRKVRGWFEFKQMTSILKSAKLTRTSDRNGFGYCR